MRGRRLDWASAAGQTLCTQEILSLLSGVGNLVAVGIGLGPHDPNGNNFLYQVTTATWNPISSYLGYGPTVALSSHGNVILVPGLTTPVYQVTVRVGCIPRRIHF
jgi:hypothetical protein